MKIERGIPVPTIHCGKPLSYPWPDMQPGDSILVPVEKCGPSGRRAVKSFSDWAARQSRTDIGITCRTVAPGKVRIWIIAKGGKR